jgi:hypothetical protein
MESSAGEKTHVLKIELYGHMKLNFDVTFEAGMALASQAIEQVKDVWTDTHANNAKFSGLLIMDQGSIMLIPKTVEFP